MTGGNFTACIGDRGEPGHIRLVVELCFGKSSPMNQLRVMSAAKKIGSAQFYKQIPVFQAKEQS